MAELHAGEPSRAHVTHAWAEAFPRLPIGDVGDLAARVRVCARRGGCRRVTPSRCVGVGVQRQPTDRRSPGGPGVQAPVDAAGVGVHAAPRSRPARASRGRGAQGVPGRPRTSAPGRRVAERWRLDRFGNAGITALFAGEPGTGRRSQLKSSPPRSGSTSWSSISRCWCRSGSARPRRTSTRSSPRRDGPTACCSSTKPTPCTAPRRGQPRRRPLRQPRGRLPPATARSLRGLGRAGHQPPRSPRRGVHPAVPASRPLPAPWSGGAAAHVGARSRAAGRARRRRGPGHARCARLHRRGIAAIVRSAALAVHHTGRTSLRMVDLREAAARGSTSARRGSCRATCSRETST